MAWRLFVVAAVIGVAAAGSAGEDWPGWRGPRGDGTSAETGVPLKWSAAENILWKVPVPGRGYSSPIVFGDRIYLTSCDEAAKERLLIVLDRRDGKTLWKKTVLTAPLEKKNNLNSYASGTPVTDGKHIWVTFLETPNVQIVCYDADGNEVWRRSPGEFHSMHGYCSSMLLYKDLLILNADQDALAYIVALDQATGTERWRIDRPNRTRSYAPPVVFEAAGKKQMVVSGSKCVASYDPDTGKQYWIVDGPTEQMVASLVYGDGLFFVTGGYPSLHVLAIKPDGTGNVTATHVAWHEKAKPYVPGYVPSPIAAGKLFFWVADGGTASCVQAATGKLLWSEPLGRHFSVSPVSAEGRLYCLDDEGVMHILAASEKFEKLSENALGEECRASPALSRGHIYIRGLKNLYAIGPAEK